MRFPRPLRRSPSRSSSRTRTPSAPHVHVSRGRIHAARGELEAAVADFTRALELHSELPGSYLERGRALFDLGDVAAAHTDFDRVLALEPGNIDALQGRAVAAIDLGVALLASNDSEAAQDRFYRALEDCDAVLAVDDRDPFAHWHRALALRGLDAHDWGAEALERAIALMPSPDTATIARLRADRGEALRLWGETAGRADKLEEALAEFAAAEPADLEDLAWTLSSRAAGLVSLGRHDSAEPLF